MFMVKINGFSWARRLPTPETIHLVCPILIINITNEKKHSKQFITIQFINLKAFHRKV